MVAAHTSHGRDPRPLTLVRDRIEHGHRRIESSIVEVERLLGEARSVRAELDTEGSRMGALSLIAAMPLAVAFLPFAVVSWLRAALNSPRPRALPPPGGLRR